MRDRIRRPRPAPAAERERQLVAIKDGALAIGGDVDLDRRLEKILKTAARLVTPATSRQITVMIVERTS